MIGPLLSVQDVAVMLAVSPKTIRGLVARGELTAHRVGACIRIAPEAVGAYLDATVVGVSAPVMPPLPHRADLGRTGGLRAAFAARVDDADGQA